MDFRDSTDYSRFNLYACLVLILGFIAAMIAIPIANWIAINYAAYLAELLNFNTNGQGVSVGIILIEYLIACCLPLIISSYVLIKGCRISVKDALGNYGIDHQSYGQHIIERVLSKFNVFNKQISLGIRNTCRQKSRFLLTLITLVCGGTFFIAALTIHSSIKATVFEAYHVNKFDFWVFLNKEYQSTTLQTMLLSQPYIDKADTWIYQRAAIRYSDGSLGKSFRTDAIKPDTPLLDFRVVEGRWLTPNDKNSIVINQQLAKAESNIKVGDQLNLSMDGEDRLWHVVGIVHSSVLRRVAYTNMHYVEKLKNVKGKANALMLSILDLNSTNSDLYAEQITKLVENNGYSLGKVYNFREAIPGIEAHILT